MFKKLLRWFLCSQPGPTFPWSSQVQHTLPAPLQSNSASSVEWGGVCIPTPPPRGASRWIPETLTFQSGALTIAALWKCCARRQDAKNLHKHYGLLLLFAAPVDQKQESALPAACRPPPPPSSRPGEDVLLATQQTPCGGPGPHLLRQTTIKGADTHSSGPAARLYPDALSASSPLSCQLFCFVLVPLSAFSSFSKGSPYLPPERPGQGPSPSRGDSPAARFAPSGDRTSCRSRARDVVFTTIDVGTTSSLQGWRWVDFWLQLFLPPTFTPSFMQRESKAGAGLD